MVPPELGRKPGTREFSAKHSHPAHGVGDEVGVEGKVSEEINRSCRFFAPSGRY